MKSPIRNLPGLGELRNALVAALSLFVAVGLLFALRARAATIITDLQLSGTANSLETDARLTIADHAEISLTTGASLTAESGSIVDLFHATVALPESLALKDISLEGTANRLGDGARLTLNNGSTFIAETGSTIDFGEANITLPVNVVLTTGAQTLIGKTLVSPTVSSITSAANTNLTLATGTPGATMLVEQGTNASAILTPRGTGFLSITAPADTNRKFLEFNTSNPNRPKYTFNYGASSNNGGTLWSVLMQGWNHDGGMPDAPMWGTVNEYNWKNVEAFQDEWYLRWVEKPSSGTQFRPIMVVYDRTNNSSSVAIRAAAFTIADHGQAPRALVNRAGMQLYGADYGVAIRTNNVSALAQTNASGSVPLVNLLKLDSNNQIILGDGANAGAIQVQNTIAAAPTTNLLFTTSGTSEIVAMNSSGNSGLVGRRDSSSTSFATGIPSGFSVRNSDTTDGNATALSFTTSDGSVNRAAAQIGAIFTARLDGSKVTGQLTFHTNSGAASVTERMRLTSAGNLLIGTSDSTWLTGVGGLKVASTSEAATVGSGSIVTAGGIYAAKQIISGSNLVSGGNMTVLGGGLAGGSGGLVLNSSLLAQPIRFSLNAAEAGRFSGTTGNLLIGGTTDISGTGGLKIFGTTASNSTTTGAFQVRGGAGIGGTLNVGGTGAFVGRLRITNNSDSTNELEFFDGANSTQYGTIGIAGAAGALSASSVAQDLVVRSQAGLRLTAGGATDRLIISPADGAIALTSTTAASATNTGSLVVAGGVAVQKQLYLGDDFVLVPTAATPATIRVSGTAVTGVPGIWFADAGDPTSENAALAGTANSTIVNAASGGRVALRLGNTDYFTLTPSSARLETVPLKVVSGIASSSTTTGSATFLGGIGVTGRVSAGSLTVGTGSTSAPVTGMLSVVVSLNFPSIAAGGGIQDLTVAVSGATVGNAVNVTEAGGAFTPGGIVLHGIVTAINTVTVRVTNVTGAAIDPAAISFRVTVMKF